MKIMLINPPWYRLFGQETPGYPIGLCYIAGLLEKNNFRTVVYDADSTAKGFKFGEAVDTTKNYRNYIQVLSNLEAPIWKEIKNTIRQESPDVIGISVKTPSCKSAINVAKLVKEVDPNVLVVFGGVHPTLLPEESIRNEDVDFVVRGEGEYTFLNLVESIKAGKELKGVLGITYKDNGKIIHNQERPLIQNLDTLPFPARHLLLNKEDYLKTPEFFGYLFATRGCPYNCIFCASHKIWTRKVRFRSPENIVKEIEETKEIYKTKHFRFQDDSFTLNKKFVIKLCDLLIEENLDITWWCEARADNISSSLIRKMKDAGCESLAIGVESGDDEILRKIKKNITVKQIKNAAKILRNKKLKFDAFFMFGFPWEREKEIEKTVSLMKELDPNYAVYSIVTPYPGTELYEICKREELIPENIKWNTFFHQSPDMFLNKNITKEKIERIINETELIFKEHNRRKRRKLLLNPKNFSYVVKRLWSGGYYRPTELFNLIKLLR